MILKNYLHKSKLYDIMYIDEQVSYNKKGYIWSDYESDFQTLPLICWKASETTYVDQMSINYLVINTMIIMIRIITSKCNSLLVIISRPFQINNSTVISCLIWKGSIWNSNVSGYIITQNRWLGLVIYQQVIPLLSLL